MLQQICINAATTTAITNAQVGSAAVVTNAAAAHAPRFSYAVSKCSEPRKSGCGALDRWRGMSMLRLGERLSTPPTSGHHPVHGDGVVVSPVASTACAIPSTVALPPALWASLVIGKSLCG